MVSNQNSSSIHRKSESAEKIVGIARWAFIVFIVLAGLTMLIRLGIAVDGLIQRDSNSNLTITTNEDGSQSVELDEFVKDIRAIEDRSNNAVSSAEIILGFLEGATVLVGLAVGAAALYGFSQIQDIRDQVDKELAKIALANNAMREEFSDYKRDLEIRLASGEDEITRFSRLIEPHIHELEHLTEINHEMATTRNDLEEAIDDVTWLLQADQEFRLSNFTESHQFASHVLHHNSDHPLAMYIVGWLKVHHIRGELDNGLKLLEGLMDIMHAKDMEWPTAKAAYGVGIRRKAREIEPENEDEYKHLLRKAEIIIEEAISLSPNLVDFNSESFWGPIGGIRRDLNRLDEAIEAYENATKVTPGSSYPQGNLATLYLSKAARENDPQQIERYRNQAKKAFNQTNEFARAKLSHNPNEYFHMQDIAMACIMIDKFTDGHQFLDRALGLHITKPRLNISYKGWQDLLAYCPDEWKEIKAELVKANKRMEEAIALAPDGEIKS